MLYYANLTCSDARNCALLTQNAAHAAKSSRPRTVNVFRCQQFEAKQHMPGGHKPLIIELCNKGRHDCINNERLAVWFLISSVIISRHLRL